MQIYLFIVPATQGSNYIISRSPKNLFHLYSRPTSNCCTETNKTIRTCCEVRIHQEYFFGVDQKEGEHPPVQPCVTLPPIFNNVDDLTPKHWLGLLEFCYRKIKLNFGSCLQCRFASSPSEPNKELRVILKQPPHSLIHFKSSRFCLLKHFSSTVLLY